MTRPFGLSLYLIIKIVFVSLALLKIEAEKRWFYASTQQTGQKLDTVSRVIARIEEGGVAADQFDESRVYLIERHGHKQWFAIELSDIGRVSRVADDICAAAQFYKPCVLCRGMREFMGRDIETKEAVVDF